ncbi:MAG: hypothetical protein CK548_09575 [Opitutia bacterium]|nr:MAG: hypothetical protein CK548_09575 [Opitutae bacterium]
MVNSESPRFIAGVVEGFYGPPWSPTERGELFDTLAAGELNTYLYAPKDDLKHRAIWREVYTAEEAATLTALIQGCTSRGLNFIYAVSPGLDIRYSDLAELERLHARIAQMLSAGCEHFALLFDDIPDRMHLADREAFGSFAAAQSHVATALFRWLRERSPAARFLFCPTPYCGRMAERKLGGENYLATIGRELPLEIDVLWTGPEIISREVTVEHVREMRRVLQRKPLLWDNLHANDYDGHRFFCGPYAGRTPELRKEIAGVLLNPNCEFPLNFVPLRTFAAIVRESGAWDARAAYLAAMSEWLPRFVTVSGAVSLADLVLLGDCYYLPHEEGPEADAFFRRAAELLTAVPSTWGEEAAAFLVECARLRELCGRLAELRDRPLFYALSRRIWELREELDLLERYVTARSENKSSNAAPRSDFHLPGTYRGGLVAKLQRLLTPRADGSFTPLSAP